MPKRSASAARRSLCAAKNRSPPISRTHFSPPARAPKPAPAARVADAAGKVPRFSALLGAQAVAVGALTALIGAGGGFLIVPALVLVAHLPVREAVGSSLLIIAMNATSGVAGYLGQVAFDWRLVGWFTSVAAVGAVAAASSRSSRRAARTSGGAPA